MQENQKMAMLKNSLNQKEVTLDLLLKNVLLCDHDFIYLG